MYLKTQPSVYPEFDPQECAMIERKHREDAELTIRKNEHDMRLRVSAPDLYYYAALDKPLLLPTGPSPLQLAVKHDQLEFYAIAHLAVCLGQLPAMFTITKKMADEGAPVYNPALKSGNATIFEEKLVQMFSLIMITHLSQVRISGKKNEYMYYDLERCELIKPLDNDRLIWWDRNGRKLVSDRLGYALLLLSKIPNMEKRASSIYAPLAGYVANALFGATYQKVWSKEWPLNQSLIVPTKFGWKNRYIATTESDPDDYSSFRFIGLHTTRCEISLNCTLPPLFAKYMGRMWGSNNAYVVACSLAQTIHDEAKREIYLTAGPAGVGKSVWFGFLSKLLGDYYISKALPNLLGTGLDRSSTIAQLDDKRLLALDEAGVTAVTDTNPFNILLNTLCGASEGIDGRFARGNVVNVKFRGFVWLMFNEGQRAPISLSNQGIVSRAICCPIIPPSYRASDNRPFLEGGWLRPEDFQPYGFYQEMLLEIPTIWAWLEYIYMKNSTAIHPNIIPEWFCQ